MFKDNLPASENRLWFCKPYKIFVERCQLQISWKVTTKKKKRHTHLSINLHRILCTRFKFHSLRYWRVLRSYAGEVKVRSNKWGSSASTRRVRVLNVLFDILCWHYQSLSYIDVINQGGVQWTTSRYPKSSLKPLKL